eukprot:11835759-Prorocentrum_lima.AAC.1
MEDDNSSPPEVVEDDDLRPLRGPGSASCPGGMGQTSESGDNPYSFGRRGLVLGGGVATGGVSTVKSSL